jgi:hypothetical protein
MVQITKDQAIETEAGREKTRKDREGDGGGGLRADMLNMRQTRASRSGYIVYGFASSAPEIVGSA